MDYRILQDKIKIGDRVNIDGHFLKNRTIELISERLQASENIKYRLFKDHWNPWYKKARKVGLFWGKAKNGQKKFSKILYEVTDTGYTTSWVLDGTDLIRTANPRKLPLMLDAPEFTDLKPSIINALKGELTMAKKRQDLVNEHIRLEIRLKHINKVCTCYKNMLKKYIRDKYSDRIYDRYEQPFILILNIRKYTYHFYCSRTEINDLDTVYYTVKPEEKIAAAL